MALEVLADQDQPERIDGAERATRDEEQDHESGYDGRDEGEGDGDRQRRDRAKLQEFPASVAVGEEADDKHQHRLAQTEDGDQRRGRLVVQAP